MLTKGAILKVRILIPIILCGIILFWSFQASGEEWTDAQKDVWKSVVAFWENSKKGDLEAVMAGFHDDYAEWWSGKIIPLGKELMEAHYREWLSGLSKPVSYELEPLSIHIFGDVANVFYLYKWHKDVVPGFHHGRAMNTYLMQENKWMLIGGMDALCTKLPPCK